MKKRSPPAAPKRSPLPLAVRWPIQRAWQLRNPEKTRAHEAVRLAIKRGELVRQPCEDAGDGPCSPGLTDAHHPDYAKPLAVIWLCRGHHKRRHAKGGMSKPP